MFTATPTAAALTLSGITKRFPGALALDCVDFDLRRGEVHALLGENGAGKSTLIKVLTGLYQPEHGQIRIDGSPVTLRSPLDASRHGVTLVPQDVLMVPQLSIGRNVLLGGESCLVAKARLTILERELVAEAMAKVGAVFDPETPTASLSVPHRRLAQIARALLHPGAIIVLDEPTAVLSEPDADQLLDRLEGLRAEGKAILYVTHRLSEVLRLADRSTVLCNGRRVGQFRRGDAGRDDLVRLMAKPGDTPRLRAVARHPVTGPTGAPSGANLSVHRLSRGLAFRDISFDAAAGRLIGIAGVQGSGHGYLLRAIAGVDPVESGSVIVNGRVLKRGSVRDTFAQGVLLVPADRRGAAIVQGLTLRENLAISRRARPGMRRFGLRWPQRERAAMQEFLDALSIRPNSTEARIGTLSGGNQQKVVLSRVLESSPRILLIDEPTQGVDVASKAEIQALLWRAAREHGVTVVIASSEFAELIGFVDDILVMRSGHLVACMAGTSATYSDVLRSALL